MKNWLSIGLTSFLAWLLTSAAYAQGVAQKSGDRHLSAPLAFPDWIDFSGEIRSRGAWLAEPFQAASNRGNQALAQRTLLQAQIDLERIQLTAELQDSRQYFHLGTASLNTGMINPMEPLQAYMDWDLRHLGLDDAAQAGIRVGRQTYDMGSRRLIARNRFRNTINGFTGIRAYWQTQSNQALDVFFFLPQQRRPTTRRALNNHDIEIDRERTSTQVWGALYQVPITNGSASAEAFLVVLDEEDRPSLASLDRRLWTPGLRMVRPRSPGAWDYQWETIWQQGESRATRAATDGVDLKHRAHFQHLTIAYTWNSMWQPRLAGQFDFASGDRNPNDTRNNRFTTLFGARRFEHGPSGIYGAFARSNILSPGYRLTVHPTSEVEIMAAHRAYWLAAARDRWTTSGLQDPSGDSGRLIGQQIELRVRWNLKPTHLKLELGGAYLFAGSFIEKTPNNTGQGDTAFTYLQATLQF